MKLWKRKKTKQTRAEWRAEGARLVGSYKNYGGSVLVDGPSDEVSPNIGMRPNQLYSERTSQIIQTGYVVGVLAVDVVISIPALSCNQCDLLIDGKEVLTMQTQDIKTANPSIDKFIEKMPKEFQNLGWTLQDGGLININEESNFPMKDTNKDKSEQVFFCDGDCCILWISSQLNTRPPQLFSVADQKEIELG